MKYAVFLGLFLVSADALADTPPNAWDVAKNPQLRKDWDTHIEAQRDMALAKRAVDFHEYGPSYVESKLNVACKALEDAIANGSTDNKLRFDLGFCYTQRAESSRRDEAARAKDYSGAAHALKEAVTVAPNDPVADKAWLDYALANVWLEHPEEERDAYETFLSTASEPVEKLIPLLNKGEAEMRLGNLSQAIADFRALLKLALVVPAEYRTDTQELAKWDLAVALDRAGDPYGASVEATKVTALDSPPGDTHTYALPSQASLAHRGHAYARGDVVVPDQGFNAVYECIVDNGTTSDFAPQIWPIPALQNASASVVDGSVEWKYLGKYQPVILNERHVFFVPKYGGYWYLALGEMALAKDATDSSVQLLHWVAIERLWTQYATGARMHGGDRWLPLAERRVAEAKKRRTLLEAKLGSHAPKIVLPFTPQSRPIF